MKILGEDKGRGERDGGSVHEDSHSALGEFCREDVGLFGGAYLSKQRVFSRRDKIGDIGGIGNTVDVDFLDAPDDFFFDLFIRDAVEITDGDIRRRPFPHFRQLELKPGGFQPLS